MEYGNTFVREVKERNMTDPFEILNWYRNLYHTEDNHMEQGIMAYAINDVFMKYKELQVKLEQAKSNIVDEIFCKIARELPCGKDFNSQEIGIGYNWALVEVGKVLAKIKAEYKIDA